MRLLDERSLDARSLGLSPPLAERQLLAPAGNPYHPDTIWWTGDAAAFGTVVTVTGSQTITESEGFLSVVPSGISANDLNCILFARTIAVGDIWRVTYSARTSSTNQWLMGALVFTNGTTSTSNVTAGMRYLTNGNNLIHEGWGNTLTSLSARTGAPALGTAARPLVLVNELEYVGSNSFASRIYTSDGEVVVNAHTAWAETLTPTHVGVAWSTWGHAPVAPVLKFGPIYRV